jgi:hypothetical protein
MKRVLIVCTSQTNYEFFDYWKLESNEYTLSNQLIIIQGQDYNKNALERLMEKKIDSFDINEFEVYVLHHRKGPDINKEKEVTNRSTEYTRYYYSTQNKNLHNFWSYESRKWLMPAAQPKYPLDLLCWEINREIVDDAKVATAINGVIDYFNNPNRAKLNAALVFLHNSIGKEPGRASEDILKGTNLYDLGKTVDGHTKIDMIKKLDTCASEEEYSIALRSVADILLQEIDFTIFS